MLLSTAALAAALCVSGEARAQTACTQVTINTTVTLRGGPVPEPMTVDVFLDEASWVPIAPTITLTTDPSGHLSGSFKQCSGVVFAFLNFPASFKPTPTFRFSYRTAFNGDVVTLQNPSYAFTASVDFAGTGSGSYVLRRPQSGVQMRWPLEDPWTISQLVGPLGLDHLVPDRAKFTPLCINYDGSLYPSCYGDHEGTDYVLSGSWLQMDHLDNFVVAAADGVVTDVVDSQPDRCSGVLGHISCPCTGTITGSDGSQIACPYDPAAPNAPPANHITISHVIDQPGNPAYRVFTDYFHIRKGSAMVMKGDFVNCGQQLARVGSSGISAGPHLHFNVRHEIGGFERTDPYAGHYSPQSYWTDQTGGTLGFPSQTCQTRSYSATGYDASVTAQWTDQGTTAPAGAGLTNLPSGPAHWYRVDAFPAVSGSFNTALVQLAWTLPSTAVTSGPLTTGWQALTFWVPIANGRDANLSQFSFDVKLTVKQTQPVAVQVQRSAHVDLPRPSVALTATGSVVRDDGLCAQGPHYFTTLTATPTGLSGVGATSWHATRSDGVVLTGTGPSFPLGLCYGQWADLQVSVSDGQGLLAATATQRYVTPTFVSPIGQTPNLAAGYNTVTWPVAWNSGVVATSRIYRELFIQANPKDQGGQPFAPATPKAPVVFNWADLAYYQGNQSVPLPTAAAKTASDTASYTVTTTTYPNDTLVLHFDDISWPTEFQLSVTTTDAWGRRASDTLISANGEFPKGPGDNGLRSSPTILGGTGFVLTGTTPFIDETRIPGYGLYDPLPNELQSAIRAGVSLTPANGPAYSKYLAAASRAAVLMTSAPSQLTYRSKPAFSVTRTTPITGLFNGTQSPAR